MNSFLAIISYFPQLNQLKIAFLLLKVYTQSIPFKPSSLSAPSLGKIHIDFNTKYERYDLNVEYSDSTKTKSNDLETSFDKETDEFD